MNLRHHVEPEEFKYLVWQLKSMNSSDLSERRASEMYLQKQVSEGNDLCLLIAVLCSSEPVGTNILTRHQDDRHALLQDDT
jgi:hypothetical protein